MDYGVAEQNNAIYGDPEEEPHFEENYEAEEQNYGVKNNLVDFDSAGRNSHELKRSTVDSSSSSEGKLFVGGIAWETSEEAFSNYFSKYGEIVDSVIMMDRISGRPRGFGFITFADPQVANKVLHEDHVIDGREVEVKRTVPRENMQIKRVTKTKKIFVGGIPVSLAEDDLIEYFASYGNIVERQIMMDHNTGRSRGFGFVTFENEDSVEKILSDGRIHELGGKQVEVKRAEPKRFGFEHSSESQPHRGGSSFKSTRNFGSGSEGFEGGYGGKMGRDYGGYAGNYGGYGGYGSYAGNYGGGPAGFYAGYGGYGYGYGFGGPMYGGGAYGGGYGTPGGYVGASSYDGGKGYGGRGYGGGSYGGAKGYGGGGYGGSKGYDNGGSAAGRFHPYRK